MMKIPKLKDTPRIRVDKDFERFIKEIPKERIKNGVDKEMSREKISSREMTRLLMRTPSWERVVKELSTLPRKEDIK